MARNGFKIVSLTADGNYLLTPDAAKSESDFSWHQLVFVVTNWSGTVKLQIFVQALAAGVGAWVDVGADFTWTAAPASLIIPFQAYADDMRLVVSGSTSPNVTVAYR